VFFLSGFSSLIYQVCWQRILTLYYSVEHISTTLIVSVYMLGLGIGAIIGGNLSEKVKNKVKLYYTIELLIGFFGLLSILFLEYLGKKTAGANYYMSFLFMFIFLCIPTILMGLTLPLLTKIFNSIEQNFMFSVSFLYYINTLGAAFGTIISSFVLISFLGIDTSVYIAAGINFLIALILFLKRKSYLTIDDKNINTEINNIKQFSIKSTVFLIVFITGFISISYEIVWFRLMGVLFKASAYSFSSVLFIFLLGIAIGSFLMKKKLSQNNRINKKNLFYFFQFCIAIFVILSMAFLYLLLKKENIISQLQKLSFTQMLHPSLSISTNSIKAFVTSLYNLLDIFIWPIIFISIPSILMGASFPLITSIAFSNQNDGQAVGKVYFFNVLGNVSGGLVTGFVFLNYIGTENTLLLLSIVGLFFLLFIKSKRTMFKPIAKLGYLILLVVFITSSYPKKSELYKVIHPKYVFDVNDKIIFTETIDGVIVTFHNQEKLRTYINGLSHGGRPTAFFYYEAIEALASCKELKNVLIIGYGTGSITETILLHNPVPAITLVELSKSLLDNLNQIDYLNVMLKSKHISTNIEDGRKFLYKSNEYYDLILIDPLLSTSAYSNNLYSKEFFQLIKEHLKLNGNCMIWMDEYRVIPKTIASVFSNVKQYGFFCIASESSIVPNIALKKNLYSKLPMLENELLEIDSMETSQLSREQILKLNAKFPINEDYKPRCEYYIGIKYIK